MTVGSSSSSRLVSCVVNSCEGGGARFHKYRAALRVHRCINVSSYRNPNEGCESIIEFSVKDQKAAVAATTTSTIASMTMMANEILWKHCQINSLDSIGE